MQRKSLNDALAIMRDLRRRCEWDAAQTHASLRPYLIEEAHELDDALRDGDDAAMREELGDVLLQVLFHAVVAEERGAFDIEDVAGALVSKMERRHPHLYGDGEREPWERMKAHARKSIGERLPASLPALHRAHRLQDRAAGVGFDWPDARGPLEKVREEVDETAAHLSADGAVTDREALEGELGDLLFAVVNLARHLNIEPEAALREANRKFEKRFRAIETAPGFEQMTLDEKEALWVEAKKAQTDSSA